MSVLPHLHKTLSKVSTLANYIEKIAFFLTSSLKTIAPTKYLQFKHDSIY